MAQSKEIGQNVLVNKPRWRILRFIQIVSFNFAQPPFE